MPRVPLADRTADRSDGGTEDIAKPSPFDLRTWFQPERLVLLALIATGAVVLPQLLRSEEELARDPRFLLRPDQISVTPPPSWVPPGIAAELHADLCVGGTPSLLDRDLAKRTAYRAAEHPWVKSVNRVETRTPEGLRLDLEYRKPRAILEIETIRQPIDDEGMPLPIADFSPTALAALPVVRLDRSRAEDARLVRAASDLAGTLQPRWQADKLASIRPLVESTPEDPQFAIVTVDGTVILWGRPPSANYPGEPTAEQKLGRIADYTRRFGSLSDATTAYEIDIRHWREISRKPLGRRYR